MRHFYSYALLYTALLCAAQLHAQTCSLTVSNDTAVCAGQPVSLSASTGFLSYSWSPSAGLSDPSLPNPVATPGTTTTYVLTASTGGTNLIDNGDFSLGNTGFTSGQSYSSTYSPCNYYVNSVYFAVPAYAFPDHTTSSDNMFMSIDGCYTSPTVIYETTVPVMTATNYNFSFWASRADVIQPIFEIHLIGNVTGDVVAATLPGIPYSGTWTWDEYAAPLWGSGANTALTIRIVNLETDGYGNDFAIDDMTLTGPACTAVDSVTITVGTGISVSDDVAECLGQSSTLTASGGTGYVWSTGDTTASVTVNPVISTTYWVTGTGLSGCNDSLTVHVTVVPSPVALITGNDSLCEGQSTTLATSGGMAYLWSTGQTSSTINVAPASTTGYWVIVTNATNCKDTADFTVQVTPLPLPPTITPDTVTCTATLLPPLVATGQNITWYTPSGTGSTAPVPQTSSPGTTVYSATQTVNGCESEPASTTVEVLPVPVVSLPDTLLLCTGDEATIGTAYNAAFTYAWTDGYNGSQRSVSSHGLYTLSAENACGFSTDSCRVIIDPCDCYFYLPNAFSPNADGMNEAFRPVYSCRIDSFTLRIFDRWGNLVFESGDPDQAWDGKYRNRLVQQDVYVVLVQYTGRSGSNTITREYRGHVTVLR